MQSVNTCPENFKWKQGSNYIEIDAPGMYELTLSVFSKNKKPLV